jgi:glutamate-5-semialdehyde dehydrogenase
MLLEMGRRARDAFRQIALAPSSAKDATLRALADLLRESQAEVLKANASDVEQARKDGLSEALIDRLLLNEKRLRALADDLRLLAGLPDPVGRSFDERTLPNGLRLRKQSVPLGVLGVIYESRPNVTLDVAGLAIKTGNAAILRGGSETIRSNRALVALVRRALEAGGLPADAVQFVDDTDRARVLELLRLHEYVDVIIPRGGAKLHRFCRENGQIPVITGGIGICHLFVDDSADLDRCLPLIHNAKTQRPSVCNALDVVLVHRSAAAAFLPRLVDLLAKDGVRFRADSSALPFLPAGDGLAAEVEPAGPDDFDTEWLSLVLSLKVVEGLDEAIRHITIHSTAHSDGILTEDPAHARRFVAEVDSAAVYVNASTRFTDGGQFGLGAEVAVSTQRLHARGPMGLPELTTYKWVAEGDYHVRE